MRTDEQRKAQKHTYYLDHKEEKKAYDQIYAPVYRLAHLEDAQARHAALRKARAAEALRILGSQCACPGCGVA